VSYLEDEDMVIIKGKPEIFNLKKGFYVNRPVDSITWSAEQIQKGNFDHFMIKEIMEQAESIQTAADTNKGKIKEIAREIRSAKKVIFVACGTSYHSTRVAKYLFSKIANRNVSAIFAHELLQFKDAIDKKTLIVAVSQSGETADILEVVKQAKESGAKVVSITNVVGSTLARESQDTVPLNIGPEICVASTKAYTAQLAIITLLVYTLAGKFEEGLKLLKDAKRMVYYLTAKSRREHVKELAEKLKDAKSMFLLGRGVQYPTALEAALKIKEISYIHAEGFAGGELKHGNIALVEKGFPVIVFTSNNTEKDILSNASEVKARGAFVVGVGPRNNEIFDYFIKVEDAGVLNPIMQIIPMQILAYELAVLKGLDPDTPRNLAKSVTVK
jgi:glucosamine--fructose-6-phosphate aminotransferase (isomerizing)